MPPPDYAEERRHAGRRESDAIFTYLDAIHDDIAELRGSIGELNHKIDMHIASPFHPGGAELVAELQNRVDAQWATLNLDELSPEQIKVLPTVLIEYARKLKDRTEQAEARNQRNARVQHVLSFTAGVVGGFGGAAGAIIAFVNVFHPHIP